MTLDRWIALIILALCLVYGYAAWFTMDGSLPPFMRFNPIWPSTFPKALSVMGALVAFAILIGADRPGKGPEAGEIDVRRLHEYKIGQAALLLGLMVVYALALRPAGFLAATAIFLIVGSAILGERRWVLMTAVACATAGGVWWLVDGVLGIFLRPLPFVLG